MATFVIHTHGRLQEWVAEEKGYFAARGLTDYTLSSHGLLSSAQPRAPTPSVIPDNRQGAYQTYEQGRDVSVSCACHWTVNKAASGQLGRLWGECYTITPCGIFVSSGSTIRTPEDLANIGVHVGYQSGSHYTTLQALEPFLPVDRIKLTFGGPRRIGWISCWTAAPRRPQCSVLNTTSWSSLVSARSWMPLS